MEITPVLDAIESILQVDASTKDEIKLYRRYMPRPGEHSTPLCVLGARMELTLARAFLGDSAGVHPRQWDGYVSIALLGRAYGPQYAEIMEQLDTLQHTVFTVLNKKENVTLGNKVVHSGIVSIRYIHATEEFFGFELLLGFTTVEA